MSTITKTISPPEAPPEAPATWPIGYPMCLASYSIGTDQDTQLGTDPSRQYMLDKDLVIFQWKDVRVASLRAGEAARLAYLKGNASWLRLIPYNILNTTLKVNASGQPLGVITDVANGGPSGPGGSRWFARNQAHERVEHHFDPTNQWRGNEAVHVAGLNGSGENFAQCYFRTYDEYLALDGDNNLRQYYDGLYVDDTCPMPGAATTNNGATSSNYDYEQDGVIDSTTSNTVGANDTLDGGARKHRRGILAAQQAFRDRFPASWQLWRNGGRDDFDYTDGGGLGSGDPPIPLSANEWYGQWGGTVREFSYTLLGVRNIINSFDAGGGTVDSFIYPYDGWSLFWTNIEICKTYLVPTTPELRTFVVVDAMLSYRKNGNLTISAIESEYLRLYTCITLLAPQLAVGTLCTKREPIHADEALWYPGAVRGSWTMGTLNETTLVFTMRNPDQINGSARFWWQEFDNGIVIVRGDHTGISTNGAYPGGTAVACTLPDPGVGYEWRMLNAATYVNPFKGRPMRNQDPTVNNGAVVTQVSLKPKTARIVTRVAV